MTWLNVSLGEVLPFRYGKGLPARDRSESGEYTVVSSAGSIGSHNVPLTTGPSIVIGRKGTIGATYYCPNPVWPIDTTFYVEPSSSTDIRFAYYLLSSLPLNEMNNDSAVPGLNRAHAESLEISLPPLLEQRAIAATLGALDDKIESNRRITELIPRLVRAHVNSAMSHSSNLTSVSNLANFVNGGAYTKSATGAGRMVIRIAELNSGPGGSTVYNDIEVPDEKTARAGDILMSWSGSLGVYRWYRDEAIINQHIFKVSPTGYPAWLVFDRLDEVMSVFRGVAADKATTMGHIQRGHLISTNVEVPTQGVLEDLDTKISPLWDRLLLAERETLGLERLRAALLPELLSGRIRVRAEGAEA